MNVKFKNNSLVTLTRSDITKIKNQARMEAIQELLKRESEAIKAVQDGSLYLALLTGYKALIDMECDYDFAVEFGNIVADTLVLLNSDEMEEKDIEKMIFDAYGLELVREA